MESEDKRAPSLEDVITKQTSKRSSLSKRGLDPPHGLSSPEESTVQNTNKLDRRYPYSKQGEYIQDEDKTPSVLLAEYIFEKSMGREEAIEYKESVPYNHHYSTTGKEEMDLSATEEMTEDGTNRSDENEGNAENLDTDFESIASKKAMPPPGVRKVEANQPLLDPHHGSGVPKIAQFAIQGSDKGEAAEAYTMPSSGTGKTVVDNKPDPQDSAAKMKFSPEVNLQEVTLQKARTGPQKMEKNKNVKYVKVKTATGSVTRKTKQSKSSIKTMKKKPSSVAADSLKLNPNREPGVSLKSDQVYSSEEGKSNKQQSLKHLASFDSISKKVHSVTPNKQASIANTTKPAMAPSKKSSSKFTIVKKVRYFSDGAIEEITEKRKIRPDGSDKLISSTTVITYEDDNDPDGTSVIYLKPKMPKKPNKEQTLMNQQQQVENLRQKRMKQIRNFFNRVKQMRKLMRSIGGGGNEEEEEEEAGEENDDCDEDDENEEE